MISVHFPGEIDKGRLVSDSGQDLFKQIRRTETQAAGIEAGMTAEELLGKQIPVDEQPDLVLMVIHQAENTGGTRMGIQIPFHLLRRSGVPKLRRAVPICLERILVLKGFSPGMIRR